MAQSVQGGGARTGLIIGKFMPLTTGHCHLIDTALAQVDQLTVLVCSLEDEPVDGHLRYTWVRETYPQCNVLHVTDELPSYPHQHPDFWEFWKQAILSRVPRVDVVFTSEEYGDKLAATLGSEHICVDPGRSTVPISATQVRENPLRYWEYIPPAVRPYYVKRVLIFGAESTGKSTLAEQLARHFGTVHVPEYGRDYLAAKGDLAGLAYDDIPRIAAGQMETEEEAARRANRLLFCDTDLVTTTIYARHYFGRCPRFVQRLADERRYDLYLLTDVDLPHFPDAQRDLANRRAEFGTLFRSELDSRRIDYVTITGQGKARLEAAVAVTEQFLQAQSVPG